VTDPASLLVTKVQHFLAFVKTISSDVMAAMHFTGGLIG
jgi:hypothetical protein